MNAKVHAIRDAQLEEKYNIRKEVKSEEKRLDLMMEVDRLNAIKIQEEIEKKRKRDLQEYVIIVFEWSIYHLIYHMIIIIVELKW